MNDLDSLREHIDKIDEEILDLIHERTIVMKRLGQVKKDTGRVIRDLKREEEKLESLTQKAALLSIPQKIVQGIWHLFFEFSETIEK